MSNHRFNSDNYSGAHPRVLEAISTVNDGSHAPAYGDDAVTERARERFREHFGPAANANPVFNGTAANVTSISALTRPWEAVVCASSAHLNVDEGGAPEAIGHVKLLLVTPEDGKLTPELLEAGVEWERIGDQHASQPRILSISNSTEVGTVYSAKEVGALADFAHSREMLLHVDGARISNAAASLGVPLKSITTDAGVDVLSFGGTKNGLLLGEAVVFLREGLAPDFAWVRKQSMQLASKMRFISAQLEAILTDDLWRDNASHANQMATRLGATIEQIDGVELAHPVQANGVFAVLPEDAIEPARVGPDGEERFYVWDPAQRIVRLMCSWDTTPEDVDGFAAELSRACAS